MNYNLKVVSDDVSFESNICININVSTCNHVFITTVSYKKYTFDPQNTNTAVGAQKISLSRQNFLSLSQWKNQCIYHGTELWGMTHMKLCYNSFLEIWYHTRQSDKVNICLNDWVADLPFDGWHRIYFQFWHNKLQLFWIPHFFYKADKRCSSLQLYQQMAGPEVSC